MGCPTLSGTCAPKLDPLWGVCLPHSYRSMILNTCRYTSYVQNFDFCFSFFPTEKETGKQSSESPGFYDVHPDSIITHRGVEGIQARFQKDGTWPDAVIKNRVTVR